MNVPRIWLAIFATLLVACGAAAPKTAGGKASDHPTAQIALAESRPRDAGYAPDGWGGMAVAPGELVPVTPADPTWGNPTAPVTIVEFADLECSYCAKAAVTMLALREAYGPEKIRIVWKHNPLDMHDHAGQAANLGAAIFLLGGNEAFFTYVEGIYSHLLEPGRGDYSQLAIESAARAAEKAPDRIGGPRLRDAADGPGAAKVQADLELSEKLGVSGTPAFFVNGVHIGGAQPIEKFQAVIDDELQRAKKTAASGVPPERMYAERLGENAKNGRAEKQKSVSKTRVPDDTVWKVPIGASPVRGKSTALVTMVEFADFQCQFCRKASATIEELRRKYGDELRIVFKHNPLPFHEHALAAADLAIEAYAHKGNEGFWKVHDALFSTPAALGPADLEAVSTMAGVSKNGLSDAQKKKDQKVIDEDQDLAADLDATGTPTFFINGKVLGGAESLEKFETIIDAELSAAKAKVAAGTPRERLYDTLMKDAREASPPEKKTAPKVTKQNPSRGSGAVTLQIFSDFQCPFCKRVEPTISDLEKAFPGQIRVVWHNRPLPMHENAELAAEAALEVRKQKGDTGFWKMHDLLFGDQSNLDRASLDARARQLGVDMDLFADALERGAHRSEIEADIKIADELGIDATPGVLVNDVFVSGAQPLSKFKKAVRLAMKKR